MRLTVVSILAPITFSIIVFSDIVLAQPRDEGIVSQTGGDTTTSNIISIDKILANHLFQTGVAHFQDNQWHEAIQDWESALELYRKIEDRTGEGDSLGNIGTAYLSMGHSQRAIEFFEQHLTIAREIGNRIGEGSALGNLGVAYSNLGEYQRAIHFDEQVLEIMREIMNRAGEGKALGNLGAAYLNLSQYQRSIDFSEQRLEIAREIGDRAGERKALGNLGVAYRHLGQYPRAIDLYEQSLEIAREIEDRAGEGTTLGGLGIVYEELGQYQQALKFFEQHLTIAREIEDPAEEGSALVSLGNAYLKLGQYQQAINFYEQRLEIARKIDDRVGEGINLGNLGIAYNNLGQYQRAIGLYKQQLGIARETGNRSGEGNALVNMGNAYLELDQYQKAIDLYEQSLKIAREISDRAGEGSTLGNLGVAYRNLGQYQQAVKLYEQQLEITREIGDRAGEGNALGNLGVAYHNLGQDQKAFELYGQQLVIVREIGSRTAEGIILHNLGSLFKAQRQLELAIAFYKQSLNIRKQINQDISDSLLQQSFVEKVSTTYRNLADLLLTQGRISEAHNTLELLKIQELSDYTNKDQSLGTLPNISLFPEEEQAFATYINLHEVDQQLEACAINSCNNLDRLNELRETALQQYRVAVVALQRTMPNRSHEDIATTDDSFTDKVQDIIAEQPGTVVIYPLVLEDKLWLLWATEQGFSSYQVDRLNQKTLTQRVKDFRASLEDRYSDPEMLKTDAKQLYDWLIAPIEADLRDNSDIRHLVLALDRNTRYIPVAALHDGQKYLIEKYSIATILTTSLTIIDERSPMGKEHASILAAGSSQKFESFPPLPNVPIELDKIVEEQSVSDDKGIYPGLQLLDTDFTIQSLRNSLVGKNLLHIATHGEFVSGNRYASYLLLGNGEKLPIPEISRLGTALNDIHLAVLSACQTGLGGIDEEGLEIAGIGYYFFKNEVDAVMASLWNVNDASTSQLMQAFYEALSESTEINPITKAEALRIAQLSLLQSNDLDNPSAARFRRIPISINSDDQPRPESGLAHPYYWAPFILIGNSL